MMVHVCHQLVHNNLHFIRVLKASQWRIMLLLLAFVWPVSPVVSEPCKDLGFSPLVVSICVFFVVSFPLLFIPFRILLLPPLYSFPGFLCTARHDYASRRTVWMAFVRQRFFYTHWLQYGSKECLIRLLICSNCRPGIRGTPLYLWNNASGILNSL